MGVSFDDAACLGQLEECLERVEPSGAQAQRQTLERALQLTAEALHLANNSQAETLSINAGEKAPALVDGSSQAAEQRRWWTAARLRVLQHLERLDTSLALSGGAWNPAAFASLRDCTAAEAATALAAVGRVKGVEVLLSRHLRALVPSVLDVMSAFPETLDPKQYAPLLRQVASLRQPPPLPRPADTVETAAVAAELKEAGQYALLMATEPMCAASGGSGWHPPTQRQLAQWVCQRAQQLDAATGQLPAALALLEAGSAALHYGEPSVSALLALAQELLSLIKLSASRADSSSGSASWRMDLRQYRQLSAQQRLALLLGLLGSGDSLAADLTHYVAPFLARLSSAGTSSTSAGGSQGDTVDPQVVLRQALEAESAKRLGWVVRLVQCEARQCAAFSSAAQLAKTAGACCYASGATDAWELLSTMLSAAKDAVRADSQLGKEEQEAALQALAVVKGHVTAARLLTKHGLTTHVSTMRDGDRAAALRLLRTLLARVSRTKNTESRWVEVWMDLRSIQEHGLTQLTEEEVRSELCRALLRVGQYRLCKSYLQGLPAEAAEQLVLAASREVYLSASSMRDPAVKQAKECLSLLPASRAAQEQLDSIAAAGQLQALGLDLPPLQLQQLREQAASGGSEVFERLLAEHPRLATADSAILGKLAGALGWQQQQHALQGLLLRVAGAAYNARDLTRAEGLLLQLAGQQYKPAWQLAGTVAADRACSNAARQPLLAFALGSAPGERLLPLLLQWQAADARSGGCWGLFSAAGAAADTPTAWQEQQRWLARRLRLHLLALARSSSSSGGGDSGGGSGSSNGADGEAAALGCLLALGPRGLLLWEKLLSEQLPQPLGHQQRRRALLLGLSAGALLALQPADVDPSSIEAALAAAEARLAAPPSELLRLMQQQGQQQEGECGQSIGDGVQPQPQLQAQLQPMSEEGRGTPSPSGPASESGEAGASGSEASSTAAGSSGGQAAAAAAAAAAASAAAAALAAAAAAAAQRFHGLLLAMDDAQELQRWLPGIDAAAALAGGRDSRRQLVLQLAYAAGKPAALRALASAPSLSASPSSRSFSSAAPSPRMQRPSSTANSGAGAGAEGSLLLQRAPSRKKVEAAPGPGDDDEEEAAAVAAAAAAAAELPAISSPHTTSSSSWGQQQQLNADEAEDMLRQALALAAKSGSIPAWEVHLAFAESLLCHNQQQWGQPGSAAAQLLHASLPVLLAGPHQAATVLQALLDRVWPRCSSRWPHLFCCCLQLMQQCSDTLLAAAQMGADGEHSSAQQWQAAAEAFAACQAAAQHLLRAAPSINAKLFLQPVLQLLRTALPLPVPASSGSAQAQKEAVAGEDVAALANLQLLQHVREANAPQLAGAVDLLEQQHAAAAAGAVAAAAGSAGSTAAGNAATYPCSSSAVYLALFCRGISRDAGGAGGVGAAAAGAVDLCRHCLAHMSPAHAAGAAAYAVGVGPWPLPLPPGSPLPPAMSVPEEEQQLLLEAALDAVQSHQQDTKAGSAGSAVSDAALQQQVRQLKRRQALLAACGSLGAACPGASHLEAARAAAASLQQAPLAGSSGDAATARTLQPCLQQLLATGCPATGVLQAAATLQAIQEQPEQVPPDASVVLASHAAAAAAQQAVAAAAEALVAASLKAMSGGAGAASMQAVPEAAPAVPAGADEEQEQEQQQQLSAGDAVQNLFALLRSLHQKPEAAAADDSRAGAGVAVDTDSQRVAEEQGAEGTALAAAAAAAEAMGVLRLLVWQHLQQHAAAYDGSGGAAATEAHLQVLELLGTVGTASMWPGWSPPPAAAQLAPAGEEQGGAAGGRSGSGGAQRKPYSHQQALLFTRTAALLAVEWPEAVQRCQLSAADFGSVEAAEGALLRLAAAAEGPAHLRLLLRLLQEGLSEAFPSAPPAGQPAGGSSDAAPAGEASPGASGPVPAAGQQHPTTAQQVGAAVVPLHRVWATCLRMLLPFGDLAGALAALDQHRADQQQEQAELQQQEHAALQQEQEQALPSRVQPAAAAVTHEEAAALLEAADATQGAAAAAALALLLPYPLLRRQRWQQLLQACRSSSSAAAAELAAALPGLAPLLLLLVQQQPGQLAELAGGSAHDQQLFKLLLAAGQHAGAASAAYTVPLGGSALTLQMAVSAAAVAELARARQYTAAGWAAMQASGTPRLWRVLDGSTRVLTQLLQSCAPGSPAAAGIAAAARELAAGAAAHPGLPLVHTAAALLQGLPSLCAHALAQLNTDLQLH